MKVIYFILPLFIVSLQGFSQNINLKVVIEGIEEKKGTIYLSLHNNKDSFPSGDEKPIQAAEIKNFNSQADFTFKGLKRGVYAVSVFQDLNGNQELDTNFIGIPNEPVGASKMTSFGRPKFSKCKFTVNEDTTIRIKYMN